MSNAVENRISAPGDMVASQMESHARTISRALESCSSGTVVLDLEQVGFVDCKGLAYIESVARELGAQGRALHLRTPNDQILNLLRVAWLPPNVVICGPNALAESPGVRP